MVAMGQSVNPLNSSGCNMLLEQMCDLMGEEEDEEVEITAQFLSSSIHTSIRVTIIDAA